MTLSLALVTTLALALFIQALRDELEAEPKPLARMAAAARRRWARIQRRRRMPFRYTPKHITDAPAAHLPAPIGDAS